MEQTTGSTTATVIVKATPVISASHRETVCCAAVTNTLEWMRLYPVSFRYLKDGQKFGRWDRIEVQWRRPKADKRPESYRIDQDGLTIVGKMKEGERARLLDPICVASLRAEREAGRTLALLRPDEIFEFRAEQKSLADIHKEEDRMSAMRAQGDLLNGAESEGVVPLEPCPYRFVYRYRDADGEHRGTCQDWETDATFYRFRREHGDAGALRRMTEIFGDDYPRRGMALAMGTHSRRPDQWLVNGVIRLDRAGHGDLFL